MPHEIVFREKYGALGRRVIYIKPHDQNVIVYLNPNQTNPSSFFEEVSQFFRQVFLPQGYPESVSDDYYAYQLWDTVQAFCSTLSGTLTTQAIMKGVGVGDTAATPIAAAITWILKDGTGMVGRILFAWFEGTRLDGDCKKWRLFADGLNDLAMGLELLLPTFIDHSTSILCVATAMKAVVGVAGGATRAAITQHQAIRNNMADVCAKDGSQETFVNLCASIAGILILSTFDEGEYMWQMFIIFTIIHLYSNLKAVRSLKMLTLNTSRLNLLLYSYLTKESVTTPIDTNLEEPVIIGTGLSDCSLCGFHIRLGSSLKTVLSCRGTVANDIQLLANVYRTTNYFVTVNVETREIFVTFQQGETARDVIEAYFYSVMLGIAICIVHKFPLKMLNDTASDKEMIPVFRLKHSLREVTSESSWSDVRIPLEEMLIVQENLKTEFNNFRTDMQSKGWNLESHHLNVDEWRGEWKRFADEQK